MATLNASLGRHRMLACHPPGDTGYVPVVPFARTSLEPPGLKSLVVAWRKATVFTEGERAALEVTEQGTRLAGGGGVSDEAWANGANHYDDDQLGALVPHRPHQPLQPPQRHHWR